MSLTAQFLRRPFMTGAVAASSRRLAHVMTRGIGLEEARLVVELGPGTGVFTAEILDLMAPGARLVAIELNPHLARGLSASCRDERLTVVHGPASELAAVTNGPVDAVVCGLPWSVMPTGQRHKTLEVVAEALAPGGRFTTFAYLHAAWSPPARRFAAELHASFPSVERSRVVWPNLPPAFAYRATRPGGQGRSGAAAP